MPILNSFSCFKISQRVNEWNNKFYPSQFSLSNSRVSEWEKSGWYFSSVAVGKDLSILGSVSILVTSMKEIEKLLKGEIDESGLSPYKISNSSPALYFLSLILPEPTHGIGVLRAVFHDIRKKIRETKVIIGAGFCLSMSKNTTAQFFKKGFEKIGEDTHSYPILRYVVNSGGLLDRLLAGCEETEKVKKPLGNLSSTVLETFNTLGRLNEIRVSGF